jgi:hypothetical protein
VVISEDDGDLLSRLLTPCGGHGRTLTPCAGGGAGPELRNSPTGDRF